MLPGDKPKDFINRLLNDSGTQPPPETSVDKVVAEVKQELETKPVDTKPVTTQDPVPEFGFEKKAEPQKEEPKVDTKPAESEPPEIVEPGSLAESYKNLNKKFKETKTTLATLSADLSKAKTELEEYKTGAVVPEVLAQKEAEIQRLSSYEKLFNFKGSKAYQEGFVKPLTENDTQLKSIFKDYEIPDTMIEKVESITNRAERNRFLSEHFDMVGADEVRRLLDQRTQLKTKVKEVESGSTSLIQQIENEHKQAEAARDAERKAKIAARAKDSWVKSVYKAREEGRMPELILSDTDEEHNARIVRPLLTSAATEYGKMVTHLAEAGLTELSEDLAAALASMALLAHASAVAGVTRDAALKHAEAAEEGTKIGNGYFRPQHGGGVPSISGNGSAPQKQTLEQGMDGLLNKVLSK